MNDIWSAGVVVGIDGSTESRHALAWAASAAHRHQGHVVVVSAYPPTWGPFTGATAGVLDDARAACESFVRRAVDLLPPDAAGGVVRRVEPGSPAAVLVDYSRTADLVVVGRGGVTGFDRLMLGSVSQLTAAMAAGPVAVVPPRAYTGPPERVVVGIGDFDEDPTALLDMAFAEGRAAGCPVRLVHAIEPRTEADVLVDELMPSGAWHDIADAEMQDLLERWSDKYTDVDRTVCVCHGAAAMVLLDAAAERDLLVVGGRRHLAPAGRLLGSVPDTVARRARGTVVIVHDRKER